MDNNHNLFAIKVDRGKEDRGPQGQVDGRARHPGHPGSRLAAEEERGEGGWNGPGQAGHVGNRHGGGVVSNGVNFLRLIFITKHYFRTYFEFLLEKNLNVSCFKRPFSFSSTDVSCQFGFVSHKI